MRQSRYFSNRINKTGKNYITNLRITAEQLRVIDHEGKLIGVISRSEAMRHAQDADLDLILIAPNAKPPVAKITDYKKFLYEEEKKNKEARKGTKKGIVKEIKLSLFIGPADKERLSKKTQQFLDDGHQVRLNLGLRGREIGKRTMAMDMIKAFIADLGEVNLAKEPRFEGKVVRSVVSRKK
ncbi:MAG: translation initiation factor IF-3 [bacterium]|nr:translation initiation factor IF-3 [bacterium]